MKRAHEYTEADLLEMDSSDIAKLIDIECMHEGAPLLPPEPVLELPPVQGPDATTFRVGGKYATFIFRSPEVAAEVTSFVNKLMDAGEMVEHARVPGAGYSDQMIRQKTEHIEISPNEVYSSALGAEVTAVLAARKDLKDAHESATRLYDEATNLRESVAGDITDRWQDARNNDRRLESNAHEFGRYVVLAENDIDAARTFFAHAHDIAADLTSMDEILARWKAKQAEIDADEVAAT